MAPIIMMSWDEKDPLGDPIARIEVLNTGIQQIEVPEGACGFRLETPGGWDEPWQFGTHGNPGIPFFFGGYEWSSEGIGVSKTRYIEARGPVVTCAVEEGSYTFATPMGGVPDIPGDDPVGAGAGSFAANFIDEHDITWLFGLAGEPEPLPGENPEDIPGEGEIPKEVPEPEFPPEFFELPPSFLWCIQDFEGEWHCLEPEEDKVAIAPGLNFIMSGQGAPPPGIALLVAAGSGIIPNIKVIASPVGKVSTPSSGKVEVACPAELMLTATFHKAPEFDPAIVKYRFRFAHGPISTVFSTLVDGETSVSHSVPIPLPPPLGGSGGHPPGPGNIAVFVEPPEVNLGGTHLHDQKYQIEALPENEHKSAVRVEVINVKGGTVVSNWITYHVVCTEASLRPVLSMGQRGEGVHALQAVLNRWLRRQKMPLLKIDGIFGPRTEMAVKVFQRAKGLEVDGTVELKTWKQLLSLQVS
jgi:hypothetical protein